MYTKKRAEFGRQALLSDTSAQININVEPEESLRENFIEKDPVDMAVQYAPEMTEHEVKFDLNPTLKLLHNFSLGRRQTISQLCIPAA